MKLLRSSHSMQRTLNYGSNVRMSGMCATEFSQTLTLLFDVLCFSPASLSACETLQSAHMHDDAASNSQASIDRPHIDSVVRDPVLPSSPSHLGSTRVTDQMWRAHRACAHARAQPRQPRPHSSKNLIELTAQSIFPPMYVPFFFLSFSFRKEVPFTLERISLALAPHW